MKKVVKVLTIVTMMFCIVNMFSPIFAADFLNTIFDKGGSFFRNGINDNSAIKDANTFTSAFTKSGGLIDAIKTLGYLIFFIAGAILGIRYMISGVEGKTLAKNGLISYSIGAVFFYLADQLFTFVYDIFTDNISSATSYDTLSKNIWATFSTIISMVMVAVVVIYGLKYMWASADNKANLKKGMVPMVVGAILIMCTLQILTFIVNISDDTLGNNTTYNVSYVKEINHEREILFVDKV